MLTSIAIILLLGLLAGWLFSKLKLPSLLGMIIVGIILSPNALNLVDESILTISGDLRQIALVIILTRAGLSLNFSDLKKVGRPAILMCFVPACIEMIGTIIFMVGFYGLNAAIGFDFLGDTVLWFGNLCQQSLGFVGKKEYGK